MIALSIVLGVSVAWVALVAAATIRIAIATFAALEREKRVDDAKLAEIRAEVLDIKRKVDKLGTQQALAHRRS